MCAHVVKFCEALRVSNLDIMNVGSILNRDSQPEAPQPSESPSLEEAKSLVTMHQRHLINNLLNDPAPGKEAGHQDQRSDDGDVEDEMRRAVEEFDSGKEEGDSKDEQADLKDHKEDQKAQTEDQKDQKEDQKEDQKDQKEDGVKKELVESLDDQKKKSSVVDEKELETIRKLKQSKKKGKPTRYQTPPIWAQEWSPALQRNGGLPNNGQLKPGIDFAGPVVEEGGGLSDKHVFDRSLAFSADLECSITGVIPPPSVVRTVAEWLYANFVEIPLENRKYVELELKFGSIIDKSTGRRLDVGVSTECVYTRVSDINFEMGVHEVGWADMCTFFNELEKTFQDEKRRNAGNPKSRKFQTLESDDTDQFYQIKDRNDVPKRVRITKDNSLVPPRYLGIEKKRILDLYIHSPSSMYDLRFSLLFELPLDENSIDPIMKKNKPILTRSKKRSSWSHTPTVTKFDLTKVSVPKTARNKAGKTVVENEIKHEVELELDPIEIFRGFDKIRDGSDTIRFEELVEVFLNNARCLNNRVTRLALK